MSTFENLRLCKKAEYDYFLPERIELDTLEINGLYVAMYSLRKKVFNAEALALPILIAELDDELVKFKLATGQKDHDTAVHPMRKSTDNYVKLDTVVVEDIGSDQGYLRDYNEGLDGPVDVTNVSESITKTDKTLALA